MKRKIKRLQQNKVKGDVPLEAGNGILASIFTIFVCMLWKLNIAGGMYVSLSSHTYKYQLQHLMKYFEKINLKSWSLW